MSLRAGLALSGMSYERLWFDYLGLGGTFGLKGLIAVLEGEREITAHEHNMIAQALNDHFTDHGHNHPVAYAHELNPGPASGDAT